MIEPRCQMTKSANPWLEIAKEFGEAFPGKAIAPRVFEELTEQEQIVAMRHAIQSGEFPDGWLMQPLPPGCVA